MVGILIALYEESQRLLPELSFCRIDGVGQYNGFLRGIPVSVHLCGPGIKKRSLLFKWLRQHKFSFILNIGYAGALTPEFQLGESCKIDVLVKTKKDDIDLILEKSKTKERKIKERKAEKQKKTRLLTTNTTVFGYDEKEDLFLRTACSLVDMEAYRIAEVLKESGFHLGRFTVIKIIGDLPGDALYLRNEKIFRNFFSSRSLLTKLKIVFNAGLNDSWFLYQRKKFLQKRLELVTEDFLRSV